MDDEKHSDTINENDNMSNWEISEEEEEELRLEYRKKRRKWLYRGAAVVILFSFLAFSYAWFPLYWSSQLDFLQENQKLSEQAIVQNSKPAIVYIQASGKSSPGVFSQGTGFNISPEGLIITNRHVVEGANSVNISFDNEKQFFSREISFLEGYDLAVIKLADKKNLPYLPVLTEQLPQKDQKVIIIGNPLGFERISSQGNIIGFYRNDNNDNPLMVIDASIERGSSGSPVLDKEGLVIGIVFATGEISVEGSKKNCALAIPSMTLEEWL